MRNEDDIQNNINFCLEVEQYENLYDSRRTDYCLYNRTLQDESWESIAKIFESNSNECKQRWKNIRANYSNYMKKVETFGHGKIQPYYLAPYLSFLDPFLRIRKTKDKSVKKAVDDSIVKNEPESFEKTVDELIVKNEPVTSEFEEEYESVLPHDCPPIRISQSFAPSPPSNKNKKPPSQIKSRKEPPRRRRFQSFTFKKDVNPRVYHSTKIKQQLLKIQKSKEIINQIDDLGLLHSSLQPDMKFVNTTPAAKSHYKMAFLDLAAQILATKKVTDATTSTKLKVKNP